MDLNKIENPSFLKDKSIIELEQLSKEIREFLIQSISKTGGHLGPNLGVVELTLAIHKVFNSPVDKIIFDVGHQTYTHMILTNRASLFPTLRQFNGLSGFLKKHASIHDVWEAGHSSTSLSAACGFVIERENKKQNHQVISVIGDASISNGISFEALNHLGSISKKNIVILNDNGMSISQNVGAMHKSFDRLRSSKNYNNLKFSIKNLKLLKTEKFGKIFVNSVHYSKEGLKKILFRSTNIFEDLGFTYLGPINGHNFTDLINYLKFADQLNKPVIIHVLTQKGRGYPFAEKDLDGSWHGVGPFNIVDGLPKKNNKLITQCVVVANTLESILKTKDFYTITPAMAKGSGLNKLKLLKPNYFLDVGIAEEHATILAASLGANNKVFLTIYSSFLQRAYDMLIHDIARTNANVFIGIDRANLVGEDGETHHGIYDVAFLNSVPNLVIAMGSTNEEIKALTHLGMNYDGPFALRYSKEAISDGTLSHVSLGSWDFKEIKSRVVITYGSYVVKINELINEFNLDLCVVNARFIKPIDVKVLELLLNSKEIYIIEEVILEGSLAQNICTYLMENNYNGVVKTKHIPNTFVEAGSLHDLHQHLKFDKEGLLEFICA